jgi:hypothetical protein
MTPERKNPPERKRTMKAHQITTRNKTSRAVARSLAAAAVLTFFAAGPADADCNKMRIKAQYDPNYATSTPSPSAPDLPPVIETPAWVQGLNRGLANNRGFNHGWNNRIDNPILLRGQNPPQYGNTVPINDDEYRRRREHERWLRQQLIEGLKQSGVIREKDTTGTTSTAQGGNSTGATTTKPKPSPTPPPKPKPKRPKVTKLPNGDVITDHPDGRREVKFKNGDTVTTHPNGKRVIKKFGGGTTETHPSGYRKTTDRNGNGKTVYPDGTIVDFKSTGEATLTTPDGRKFHRDPGKGFKEVD